jgi:hypothetical protein
MKFAAALVMLGLSIGLASCGGDAQPGSGAQTANNDTHNLFGPTRASAQPQVAGAPKTASGKPAPRGDTPPPDAQFMIYCDVVRGPGHVQRSMELKQQLARETGRQEWHIIHAGDESSLYFGYYRTFEDVQRDPQETARAQNDRKYIESLRDGVGERRFKGSMFVPVASPDPEAPSEWNLANAPATAYWSLQVAAYQSSPDRKRAAVESVRDMRAHGIDAYYFHGDTISSVCVGLWPRSAVREQDVRDDAHTTDPNQPIMVLSDKAPAGIDPITYKDGKRVLIVAPKLEIIDKTMQAAIAQYPYHALNGEYHGKVANGQTIADPSFLVIVPHDPNSYSSASGKGQGVSTDDAVRSGANDAAAAIFEQQQPAQPQQQPGRLRSIGER